jgi:hypothetical protein
LGYQCSRRHVLSDRLSSPAGSSGATIPVPQVSRRQILWRQLSTAGSSLLRLLRGPRSSGRRWGAVDCTTLPTKIRPQRAWGKAGAVVREYASVPRNKLGSAHPLDSKWQITSYLLFWVSNRIFWGAHQGHTRRPQSAPRSPRKPGSKTTILKGWHSSTRCWNKPPRLSDLRGSAARACWCSTASPR